METRTGHLFERQDKIGFKPTVRDGDDKYIVNLFFFFFMFVLSPL